MNSETGGRFQVGRPRDLRDDDPWFADEDDAINYAAELACQDKNQIIAIWDDRSACLHLWFDNQHFKAT